MKTLGLCFVLLTFLFVSPVFAQEQSKNSLSSADQAIVQLWQAHAGDTDQAWLQGDKLIISSESDTSTCLYLRVYRQKRESRHSDVTVPSGYTTCVNAQRFNKKSAGTPKLQFIPQQ